MERGNDKRKEKETMKMEHSVSPVPLPEDLMKEIFKRLPLKSMVRMSLLSKNTWETLSNKDFAAAFLSQSTRKPQLLFTGLRETETKTYRWFLSIVLEEKPSMAQICLLPTLVSDSCTLVCQPVLGLVCCYNSQDVVICNPGARTFMALPNVNPSETEDVHCFFGFDSKSKSFKVLCITTGLVPPRNPQVFTLGDEHKSWKQLEYDFLHYPKTDGFFFEGRIYYGAMVEKYFIVSFDLQYEDFTIITLPKGLVLEHLGPRQLLKIGNKLAIVVHSYMEDMPPHSPPFEFWVLNDLETRTWSKLCIEIPSWNKLVGNMDYYCIGTNGTGQLIFSSIWVEHGDIFLLCYDFNREEGKKIWINGEFEFDSVCLDAFLDHVETPILSIRSPTGVRGTTRENFKLEIQQMEMNNLVNSNPYISYNQMNKGCWVVLK